MYNNLLNCNGSKTSISSFLQLNTQLILTGVNKHKDKVCNYGHYLTIKKLSVICHISGPRLFYKYSFWHLLINYN